VIQTHALLVSEVTKTSLLAVIADSNSAAHGTFNGLISGHLALKVSRQETHSIVLKKKVTTTY